mmetsp:Transcript_37366/g.55682  ORF Transcript_37366/g.55682 Transcript_37366/m.55682 type:complete len:640 (-) Transcript_37366:155-2074(-)|eukprot:CAMPEP_0194031524 /NCGR_PEP_ID=MMETSP0009_2-20130614/4679_1 /TAXON_ID=210454 /ORGANISM="Grammatophora oceanica, Strain CCMP 410" /LENGTH=639 /DNA_ID=CAMNT_0038671711 /DNA_START=215 /DNA_END=2134 /DNA_ORIENTATION=+
MTPQFAHPKEPLFGATTSKDSSTTTTTTPAVVASHRHLGGSGDGDNNYLVDSSGNSYPSYSLAWRYLGLFIDCSSNNNNNNNRRHLDDNNENNNACQRKLLWAAYHDPGYKGGSIGEYSFYNTDSASWDGRTCRAQPWWKVTRCQRMDCHESRTKFELIGVFKETDGLYDWTEQLFKHHGYCLWDGDKQNNDGESGSGDGNNKDNNGQSSYYSNNYNFMANMQEKWITYCTQLGYSDSDGNSLYVDTKPLPGGDMTFGIYTDASCLTESETITWEDYLSQTSSNNNNDGEDGGGGDGGDDLSISMNSIERWNSLLDDYKVCQPCRSYNRVVTTDGDSHDSEEQHEGSGEEEEEEDDDDGNGRREQWGFNCYDNAGYRNCNQCYKFETKTDMEVASTSDLVLASQQGTILAIKVDGTTYGKGHYTAPGHYRRRIKYGSIGLLFSAVLIGLVYVYCRFFRGGGGSRNRRVGNVDLKEGLTVGTLAPSEDDEEDGVMAGGGRAKAAPSSAWNNYFSKTTTPSPVVAGIPVSSSNNKNTTTPADAVYASDREKLDLMEQIHERDVKLSQQEQLIERLQRELASYEKDDYGDDDYEEAGEYYPPDSDQHTSLSSLTRASASPARKEKRRSSKKKKMRISLSETS